MKRFRKGGKSKTDEKSSTAAEVDKPASLPKREKFDPTKVYIAPRVEIPRDDDDDRFVKSFSMDEQAAYSAFFNQYGFAVIRDVLSSEECRKSIDEIWTFLESGDYQLQRWFFRDDDDATPSGIKRDDPSTWNDVWPSLATAGILGYLPVFTPQALLNRQNPNVYSAFSTLMKRKDLMVSHDRFGLFRPTCTSTGEEVKPRWKTIYSVHWDLNPWRFSLDDKHLQEYSVVAKEKVASLTYSDPSEFFFENNEIGTQDDAHVGTQGIINFADNLVEDGGFHMVVGFHQHLREWALSTKNSLGRSWMKQDFIPVDHEDPLHKQAQRVSLRAGSLVVWDQRIAHGSAPNSSANTRFCQFIKMSPAINLESAQGKCRKEVVGKKVAESGVEVSELGKKLFAFEPWQ